MHCARGLCIPAPSVFAVRLRYPAISIVISGKIDALKLPALMSRPPGFGGGGGGGGGLGGECHRQKRTP
jgi:hypothetical protein